jgi:Transposase DDE domain
MLGAIFERFAAKSPVSVMVQGSIEFALNASQLDDLFARQAQSQYTRSLFFSTVVDLLTQVVCGCRKSLHAAYQACDEPLPVSLTSVYNKLKGVEPAVARELVRHSARQLEPVLRQLGGTVAPWVAGYQVRLLDGNHLAATEHRLELTRHHSSAPLPGFVLAVLDAELMLVRDVFCCEDAHAQERLLLADVLASVLPRELYVADRNFCCKGFLLGLLTRGAFFAIREHANLDWQPAGKLRSRGRVEGGRLRERRVAIVDEEGQPVYLRRVVIELDEPTRDGEAEVAVLTNLPEADCGSRCVARLYRRRWTIEGAFQELAAALNSEIATLCYPRAALFAFCVGLLAYDVLGVVKGALRAEHGQKAVEEVSSYYLADEIGGTRRGMLIAIPEGEWGVFQVMEAEEFAAVLRGLAKRVRLAAFRKHPRGPKKPAGKRIHDPHRPHISTAHLLQESAKW